MGARRQSCTHVCCSSSWSGFPCSLLPLSLLPSAVAAKPSPTLHHLCPEYLQGTTLGLCNRVTESLRTLLYSWVSNLQTNLVLRRKHWDPVSRYSWRVTKIVQDTLLILITLLQNSAVSESVSISLTDEACPIATRDMEIEVNCKKLR